MSLSTFNIIHIVVEVVSLLSITAYFLHQNGKIMSHIDTLNQTIEEHEEKMAEQDKKINGILKSLKKIESGGGGGSSKEKESMCVDGVCSVPQSFSGFQIPLHSPFTFFEKQFSSSPSQVQEIIVEEDEDDEDNDDYKPPPVEVLDEYEEEVPHQEDDDDILSLEKDKVEVVVVPSSPPKEQANELAKKKKKKKKKTSVSSLPDLDKELEAELNELN